ncbi:hypothetical protein J6590_017550 [Homalodisca vitripennis]|nr:hypothetical protein J6590_017550 [Homalodisca vitripennis]
MAPRLTEVFQEIHIREGSPAETENLHLYGIWKTIKNKTQTTSKDVIQEPEIQKGVNLEKDAEEIHKEIEIENGLEEVVKEGLKEITSSETEKVQIIHDESETNATELSSGNSTDISSMLIPIDAIVWDDMDYGLFEDTEIIQNFQPMNTCGGIEVVGVETNLNYDLLSNETVIDYVNPQPSTSFASDQALKVNDLQLQTYLEKETRPIDVFQQHLHRPKIETKGKKRTLEKAPYGMTSTGWKEYYLKKETIKIDKEESVKKRKNYRELKKLALKNTKVEKQKKVNEKSLKKILSKKSTTGERKIDLQPSIGNGPDPDFLVNDYVIVKCVLTDQYFPGQIVDKSELSYTIRRWVRIGRSQRWFCPPNRDMTCKKEREYIIKKMSPPTETADKRTILNS